MPTLRGLALAFLLSFAATAAAALTPAEDRAIERAEDYLTSIQTLSADFVQRSANGGGARGHMLMKRPGLIRFDYAPPSEVLLVSDGVMFNFVDYEVGQVSSWPLFDTPLSYLVREKVDLQRDALVDNVVVNDEVIRFRLRDRKNLEQGSITLEFQVEPMALNGWRVVDQQGQETEVALNGVAVNETLPSGSFSFKEPRQPWRDGGR